MFESVLIEEKIATIQHKFIRTFLVLFMAPFLTMVGIFLLFEVLCLVYFTRRIFSTINDLFEKIEMLSRQHSKSLKKKINKAKGFNPKSTESLKTQEGLEQSGIFGDALNASHTSIREGANAAARLDVLQDYQGNESCMEVTKLYRAANKLIKTLSLAKTSMQQGNDNIALLNYNEVAKLFQERSNIQQTKTKVPQRSQPYKEYMNPNDTTAQLTQEDEENGVKLTFKDLGLSNNLAICYNNIACIHAKQRNEQKQNLYFQEAIKIEELIIQNNQLEKKCASIQDNLRIACKYFNYGYSLSRQFLFHVKMTAVGNLGKNKFPIKLLQVIISSWTNQALSPSAFLRKAIYTSTLSNQAYLKGIRLQTRLQMEFSSNTKEKDHSAILASILGY
ncbi:hypothetical protein FGO68_gene754 [Halteria grandinella]|uniref:Tetratricopeptide repeat protein n=1 Tax=Halteria grandinella TaxID=5974 RepID=A0A8J8T7V2_HALGN|nr:hypothetical protein FGO68_gene754 [Halteria grandinella]